MNKDKSFFQKDKGKNDGLCNYCKACCKVRRKLWYENNKIIHIKNTKEYKRKNKSKHIEYVKTWQIKNSSKFKSNQKISQAKGRRDLKEWYIRNVLLNKGYTKKALKESPELIDATRQIIKIKRYVKEKTGKIHSGA
jgi:hypothetical protein